MLDVDAAPDGSDAGCSSKIWLADFSTDPTTIDSNGDGVLDFAMRDGLPLGGVLAGGIWTESAGAGRALDSQPKQDFQTRTQVHVRMRSTTVPPSARGALFWINVGYDGTSFSPLFVEAALDVSSSQTATLYGKTDGATATKLAQVTGLDNGMHDYWLDIYPTTHTVMFHVDAMPDVSRAFPYFAAAGNDDRWATLDSGGGAEFDLVRVEVDCP